MKRRSAGFTAIEMIVTVVVAALLIIAINSLYSAVVRSSAVERNRAEASDIAYANLRHYAYSGASATSWFTCDASTDGNSAGGHELLAPADQTINAGQTPIPQPVKASVKVIAPYGCTANPGSPVLVTSTVTYGPGTLQDMVVHSEYVGF